ncbi:exonuclease domain-containing protein [Pararhodobacter sp. SW119]|uniref:exonuclease domain-containing protein n=1 Tax=Pararhodobacter sp. SW119 TaxID=2780075 RepID=UPI001ADF737C|nr:exonuclease domain-containing protein [Pararhodobacter sp. SW119]
MPARIYIYDTECTGLETRHDRPVQFAACIYDENAELLEEFNVRGRLPRYVIPSPGALMVNRQSIGAIQRSSLSHYELIAQIHDHIARNSPAIICSYNGIRYDEEILRHSFYANLRAPYLTQWEGNKRMDVLIAAKVVAACAPDALHLPADGGGKRSFRLADLAAANGFVEHDAHDALGDVHATMHLAKVLVSKAPEVWNACAAMMNKSEVRALMLAGEPLLSIGWDHSRNGPRVQVLLPICADQANPNEWLCVDLGSDIDWLLAADVVSLREAFDVLDGERAIVRVKSNAMPVLMRINDPVAAGLVATFDPRGIERLRADQALAKRLRGAAALRKSEFDEGTHPAEQLYTGGFFPTEADKPLLQRFHAASPHEKYEMIANLRDPRARHMARWLVGSEWPEVMAKGDHIAVEEEFREHLMQDEAKWTTVPSALDEIKRLATEASPDQLAILEEYEGYLLELQNRNSASVYV